MSSPEAIEIVDLSDSPDKSESSAAAVEPAGLKRKRVDIPSVEDQGKSKIMAFARTINTPGRVAAALQHIQAAQKLSGHAVPPVPRGLHMDPPAQHLVVEEAVQARMAAPSSGNSMLAQLHAERLARAKANGSAAASLGPSNAPSSSSTPAVGPSSRKQEISLLTWNVWFDEEVQLDERVSEIADIVQELQYPTFLVFQEVTHNIAVLMSQHCFWKKYVASPWKQRDIGDPYFTMVLYRQSDVTAAEGFRNNDFMTSRMGRGVRSVKAQLGGSRILVATSHLESPVGPKAQFSEERSHQAQKAMKDLDKSGAPNIIYAGDMNWNEKDGEFPLPDGWVDLWSELHPNDPGFTYDGKKNGMLGPYNRFRTRLDRVVVKMADWKPTSIKMVGTEQIVNADGPVTYKKKSKKGVLQLPLLPSDHFGLYAEFVPT